MCCFAQPVISVADTNLFARLLDDGRQYLAYEMSYRSERPNAMILPLPVATPSREDSLRFISLDAYPAFFRDLDRAFPHPLPPAGPPTRSAPDSVTSKPLVVHEVGEFVASFVPTMDDFSRLDKQFVIPRESWAKIPAYNDYGFAVFQLKSLAARPHPMAFEFHSRWQDRIFFPTVHIHDGKVHDVEEFDHAMYLQDPGFDRVVGKYLRNTTRDRATGYVRSKSVASETCRIDAAKGLLAPDLLLHRLELRGQYANQDVIANIPEPGGGNSGGLSPYLWPTGLIASGVAGLAWLFGRRDSVRASHFQRLQRG